MEDAKPMKNLMHASNPLSKDELSKPIDQKIYIGMIGSLLYLIASRPDILYDVCLCARFQSNPRESHLKVVKRISRYLVGTTNQSLFYKKNHDFRIVGYCDANYARDKVEWKSASGGCHYLGPCLISWASKKQNSITLSIAGVEYVFPAYCCSQLLLVKYQLEDYSGIENNISVYCDNTSTINLSKNPINHSKAKHIEIRYHFICDYVQKKVYDVKFVDKDHQWVDIFTKPMSEECFICISEHLNMVTLSYNDIYYIFIQIRSSSYAFINLIELTHVLVYKL